MRVLTEIVLLSEAFGCKKFELPTMTSVVAKCFRKSSAFTNIYICVSANPREKSRKENIEKKIVDRLNFCSYVHIENRTEQGVNV